jgi:hypothetical protein
VRGFGLTLGISLGAHVAIAAALLAPRPRLLDPAHDPSPQIAGETFELPAPDTQDVPLANASPSPESQSVPASPEEGDAPARPTPRDKVRGRHGQRPSHAGRPSGGRADPGEADGTPGATGTPALYGAVGERSATDLATSFTHGFPQAASGDPAWRTIPLGSAGEIDLVITLDDAGHIEGTQILGAPTPALAGGVRRTLSLIKGRPFVSKGKTTKLHLTATVSTDAVHDGLHGDVFAIGKSFAGGEGSAFFALAIGRRVDVRVRLK